MPDSVQMTAETLAMLIPNPTLRAAWLAHIAAQSERDKRQDARSDDLASQLLTLREGLNVLIDRAVRSAMEGSELRVTGFVALVDGVVALEKRMDAADEQRTEMLRQQGEMLQLLKKIHQNGNGAEEVGA